MLPNISINNARILIYAIKWRLISIDDIQCFDNRPKMHLAYTIRTLHASNMLVSTSVKNSHDNKFYQVNRDLEFISYLRHNSPVLLRYIRALDFCGYGGIRLPLLIKFMEVHSLGRLFSHSNLVDRNTIKRWERSCLIDRVGHGVYEINKQVKVVIENEL